MALLKPTSDRILIKIIKEEQVTASGIYVAGDDPYNVPGRGLVLSVGPGTTEDGKTRIFDGSVGDIVVFPRYAGTEIEVDEPGNEEVNPEYRILQFSEVLAKIVDED